MLDLIINESFSKKQPEAKRLRKFKPCPYYEALKEPLLQPTVTVRKDRGLGIDKQIGFHQNSSGICRKYFPFCSIGRELRLGCVHVERMK